MTSKSPDTGFESYDLERIYDDEFLNVCDPLLAQLKWVWAENAHGNKVPKKSDLKAELLFPFLNYLFIVDKEGPEGKYRYRLVGSREAAFRKHDPTGELVEDRYFAGLEDALYHYDYVFGKGKLLYYRGHIYKSKDIVISDQALFLPVSDDGITAKYVYCCAVQNKYKKGDADLFHLGRLNSNDPMAI